MSYTRLDLVDDDVEHLLGAGALSRCLRLGWVGSISDVCDDASRLDDDGEQVL